MFYSYDSNFTTHRTEVIANNTNLTFLPCNTILMSRNFKKFQQKIKPIAVGIGLTTHYYWLRR